TRPSRSGPAHRRRSPAARGWSWAASRRRRSWAPPTRSPRRRRWRPPPARRRAARTCGRPRAGGRAATRARCRPDGRGLSGGTPLRHLQLKLQSDLHVVRLTTLAQEAAMAGEIVLSPPPDVTVPDVPLHEFVLADAIGRADQAALVDGPSGRTLTYGQLARGVRPVGARLGARGSAQREWV